MDPEIARSINGIQQDKNYREYLSWITEGGLRYAFARHNNHPNKESFYRSKVPASKVKEVIVVGAGMAGLTAAYELAQVGHKVTILEASDRVGGRVKTYRGFDDGIHCEEGAMRIPQQHFLVSHYIGLFGLRTEAFRNSNPNTYLHMYGNKFRNSDWQLHNREYCDKLWPGWDANLPKGHNVNGITDLYKRTFGPVMNELTPESSEHDWQKWVQKWSSWTVDKFLRSDSYQEGLQEKVRPWPEAATKAYQESTYTPILDREMSGYLRKTMEKWLDYPMYGILEGMDTLPKSFLAKNENGWNPDVELQNNILFDTVLQKVEIIKGSEGQNRVRMICRNRVSDKTSVHECDAAILAVPLPVLTQIDIPLPKSKQQALEGIRPYHSTKILLQCRSRFWEKELCEGGFSKTTLPIGQLHYCMSEKLNKSGSQRGILMVYAWHDDAVALGNKDEEKAIEEAVEHISQIHPEIKTEFEHGKVQAWHKEEFTQCAVASLDHVGYVDRLETLMTPTPDLPLYLAGEGLSWSKAWLQGAIFSGLIQAYCLQSSLEDGSIVNPVTMMK